MTAGLPITGWLQEMPDADDAVDLGQRGALVSPKTAAGAWAITDYDVVSAGGRVVGRLKRRSMFMPGMAEGTIGLALGYGRSFGGSVADGVGTNSYLLRTSESILATGSLLASRSPKPSETYELATVQQHHMIDTVGRKAVQHRVPELVREATFEAYEKDPAVGNKRLVTLSVFDEHEFNGRVDGYENSPEKIPAHDFHKWGMTIDLSSCTGCSACVIACQAENNIPIVGKEQVLHGREMHHWIRIIDRYFRNKGQEFDPVKLTADDVVAVHQPMLCMHCENAPCEEGVLLRSRRRRTPRKSINMMTYNPSASARGIAPTTARTKCGGLISLITTTAI